MLSLELCDRSDLSQNAESVAPAVVKPVTGELTDDSHVAAVLDVLQAGSGPQRRRRIRWPRWLSTRRLKVVYQATNGQLAYTTMPLRQAQLTVR